jgi:hypothetical protein
MSMSVDERRTEVLDQMSGPWGKARLVKASSRYDRRQRHLAVEWCPPASVGTDLEEYAYRVLGDWWPASSVANRTEAEAFFRGVWRALTETERS